MDPLSLTVSVLTVTGACLATAKALNGLLGIYKDAQKTIVAICSETSIISASLVQIQSLLIRDAQALTSRFDCRDELKATFDTALTGCMVIFSCLDDEVQKLASYANGSETSWVTKAKYLWKEDTMKEYLQQLRGQQTAIMLLIQLLQMESLSDIRQLLQRNTAVLERCTVSTKSLRDAHPRIKTPQSIFQASSDVESTFSGAASTIGASEFEFDDLVVNSQVYRRTLAAARFRDSRTRREQVEDEGDLIDLSESLANEKEDDDTLLADLRSLSFSVKNESDHSQASTDDKAERELLATIRSCQASDKNITNSIENQVEEPSSENAKSHQYLNVQVEEHAEVNGNTLGYLNIANVAHGHKGLPQATNSKMTLDGSSPGPTNREVLLIMPHGTSAKLLSSTATSDQSVSAEDFDTVMTRPKAWHVFWKITGDDAIFEQANWPELRRQCIMWEIFQTEMFYLRQLEVWLKLYRDQLLARWPPVLENAQKFAQSLFGHIEEIKAINVKYLFHPLRSRYLDQGHLILGFSDIFDEWLNHAQDVYMDYCTDFLRTESLVQKELHSNQRFYQYTQDMISHPDARKLGWATYIRAPIHQLRKYVVLIKNYTKYSRQSSKANDEKMILRLRAFVQECGTKVADAERQIEDSKFRNGLDVYQHVSTSAFADRSSVRKLHFQDYLYTRDYRRRTRRVGFLSAWRKVHVILYDDYLVVTTKASGETRHDPETPKELQLYMEPILLTNISSVTESERPTLHSIWVSTDLERGRPLYRIKIEMQDKFLAVLELYTLKYQDKPTLTSYLTQPKK